MGRIKCIWCGDIALFETPTLNNYICDKQECKLSYVEEILKPIVNYNFEKGQELHFNIYGSILEGKFLSMIDESNIEIEVTFDEDNVSKIGCSENVNISFLCGQQK